MLVTRAQLSRCCALVYSVSVFMEPPCMSDADGALPNSKEWTCSSLFQALSASTNSLTGILSIVSNERKKESSRCQGNEMQNYRNKQIVYLYIRT